MNLSNDRTLTTPLSHPQKFLMPKIVTLRPQVVLPRLFSKIKKGKIFETS